MQRYAGIASVKLSSVNLISVTAPNIRNPTIINAGAVANDGIVILATGNLEKKLAVKANRFTKAAKEKIEALGGKTEVI